MTSAGHSVLMTEMAIHVAGGVLCVTCKGIEKLPCAVIVMAVQAVGDALSGVLMVEAGLRRQQWGLGQWAELYQDLPSRQTKVLVADRSVISTINAETQVSSPPGLQALIDQAVAGWQWFLSTQPVFICFAMQCITFTKCLSRLFSHVTSWSLMQSPAWF